jgi:transcriptional regulator of acetoin/glycerol metabolism
MVVQSAREIEQAFFMSSAQGYWVLRARQPGYVDSQPDYLRTQDDDGCLQALNPAARQWLLHSFGQLPEHIGQVFDQQQRIGSVTSRCACCTARLATRNCTVA